MKLDLRFIIPGSAAGTVLLAPGGALPAGIADGDEDEAAIVGVDAFLRDSWAFRTPVLETHPRWAGVPDGEAIPTLVTTEPPPAAWTPPNGLAFGPIPAGLPANLPASIQPRAAELLGELRDGADPPPLRPRWARPGWNARAVGWMTDALAAAGRPLLAPPAPHFLRGISAVLRGRTADGDVFLKSVFPPFHPEPVATRLLAERFPGSVPRVLAIDADEGWLLVDDLAAPWVGDLPAGEKASGLRAGARALIELQRALADDLSAFVAAGCPSRPLAAVADLLDAVLGPDGVAVSETPVPDDRRVRAVAATRTAVERTAGLGFPTTLVHGDFHAGNAALVDGRAVIIDWSDAAIGNPLIDLATWLAWGKPGPDDQEAAIDAWIDAWSGATDPVAVRERLDDILILGAAYQVISYEGIVRALEPATRYTMAGGATHYLERLEARLAPVANKP